VTPVSVPKPSFLDQCVSKGARGGEKRWRSQDGKRLYTWDWTHGEIEVFNKRGHHLGTLDQGKSVYDFLGMTRQEYALWVAEPSVLPTIIGAHAQHKNLDEIFKESKEDAPSTFTSPAPRAKELVDWLKTSKFWKRPSAE